MRFAAPLLTLFAYLCCLPAQAASPADPPAPVATWIGEYRLGGQSVPILLHEGGPGAPSLLDLPLRGARGVPLTSFQTEGGRTRFALQGGPDLYTFDGERQDDVIQGRLTQGEQLGSFSLLKLAPPPPALIAEMAGSYQLGPGHIVDIGPMDELGGQLVFLDHKTRRMGPLYGLSASRFGAGPAVGIPFPLQIQAGIVRDSKGQLTALNWHDAAGGATAVKIAPHRVEQVTVVNGAVALKGSLTLPAGAGPHPAVVFAHGSGDATRNLGVWTSFFVRQGMAVLSLDKRGAGESGGDWRKASLQEIAGDWLAGVAMLKARSDIDGRRIGVHGSSQGGWTGAIMAARSPDLAFLIVRAGSADNVLDTMVHEIGWSVREAGFGEPAVREAQAGARKLFGLAGGSWPAFSAAAAPLKARPWAGAAWPVHMTETGWGRPWSVLNARYDPTRDLQQIRIPVLWFLGEHDHNVPSASTANKLARLASAGAPRDVTVVRLAAAGHAFLETGSGNGSEVPTLSHAAPGYWDAMQAWLRERGWSRPAD